MILRIFLLSFIIGNFFTITSKIMSQPLEFYDVMDSARVKEVRVQSTSDGGWVSIAIARDSVLLIVKYDYCGHIQYNKVFTVDTFHLSDLQVSKQSINNSDSFYISCVLSSINSNAIFCLHFYPYKGDYQFAKYNSLADTRYYKNASLIAHQNDKFLYFNAGNNLDSLTGHIVRMNSNLQAISDLKFKDNVLINSIVPIENNSYILSLGDRLIAKMSNTLQFEYVLILDSLFTHLNQNLTLSNINYVAILGDYKKLPNDPTLCLLKFNHLNHSLDFSKKLIRYNNSVTPKFSYYNNLIENSDENYIVTHFTTIGGSGALLANSVYKSLDHQSTNAIRTPQRYSAISFDISYLPIENNFAYSGSYLDTLRMFNSKMNKRAKFTNCFSIPITNNNILDSFQLDTFDNLNFQAFPFPVDKYTISSDTFTLNYKRICKFFDFIIDTIPLPYCRGNEDTTFVVAAMSNDPQSINNKFVKYLWKEDNITTYNNEIKYDPSKKTYPSKYVIITYCNEVDTSLYAPMAVSCPPQPKFANVFVPSDQNQENKLYGIVFDELSKSRIKNIQWSVYNRWGEKIYTATSLSEEWDGNYKGTAVPSDSYMLAIQVLDIYKMTHNFSGIFTLIR